jgi:hypothetical protein
MTAFDLGREICQRKERWRSFLRPDAVPGFLFLVDVENPSEPLPPRPPLWPDRVQERIEWAWEKYEWLRRRATWLHDDLVPYLDNLTGTEIFAEAFGCEIERPGDTNPYARACVCTAEEADALKTPALESSSLAYLFDIADELQRRGGADAAMRMVDVQSPMDIAALIWNKEDFFPSLYEEPEAVKTLAQKVATLLVSFLDEWFRRYGKEFVAHYPDYFMPGGLTLSEDEVGAVSSDIFQEFFAEELARLSQRYGGIGMHCCADAGHQWKNFAKVPGLRLLNLCNPPTRKPEDYAKRAYPFFGGKFAQMHYGWNPEGAPETWLAQYPAEARVVIHAHAKTEEEARRICGILRELRENSPSGINAENRIRDLVGIEQL